MTTRAMAPDASVDDSASPRFGVRAVYGKAWCLDDDRVWWTAAFMLPPRCARNLGAMRFWRKPQAHGAIGGEL
jgi:hypothetical protein